MIGNVLNLLLFSSKNDEMSDEENEKVLPPYVQMVVSIMKRVLNFLPSKHSSLPLQVSFVYELKQPNFIK